MGNEITIIEACEFSDNIGNMLFSFNSNVKIELNTFFNNTAFRSIYFFWYSEVTMQNSDVYLNHHGLRNSVAHFQRSNVIIKGSKFSFNGSPSLPTTVLGFRNSMLSVIDTSEFKQNMGTVVLSTQSRIEISASVFDNNTEDGFLNLLEQGMVLGSNDGTVILNDCNFTNNNAPVIVVLNSIVESNNSLLITNNSAESGNAIIHFDNSEFIGHRSGSITVSNNLRSLLAFTSNISFMGNVEFINNQQPQNNQDNSLQEGGAITLVQSSLFLDHDGTCMLEHNQAENGGAMVSIDSNIYMSGNVTVVANGNGGVYLTDSELICQEKSYFTLLHNTATHKGGGVHAISSFVKASSVLKAAKVDTAILNFTYNAAENGGGLSLEANARLIVLKYGHGDFLSGHILTYNKSDTILFSANHAMYGGTVYVDDVINSGMCTINPKTECFFQVLAYIQGLYNQVSALTIPNITVDDVRENLEPMSLYFMENNASVSGSTLYGGLLDRCAVSHFAEVCTKYEADVGDGITYLMQVSSITDVSISSPPVKLCLCMDNEHDCTHNGLIEVKKGGTFTVSLTSIDQINHPVNGLIHASLNFAESAVASGQATREIPAKCTNLKFNVFSPHSTEQLTLYALDGPCKDADLSKISIDINFLPCSCLIGLQ